MVALALRPQIVLNFRSDSAIGSFGTEVREVGRHSLYDLDRGELVNVLEFGLPDSPAWQALSRRERGIQLAPVFRRIYELQVGHDLRIMFRVVREESLLSVVETASAMMDNGLDREKFRFILYPVLYGFKAERGRQIIEELVRQYGFSEEKFICFDCMKLEGLFRTRRF